MNTSSQFNDNRVLNTPFHVSKFYADGVGVKNIPLSDYVYHSGSFTPIRSLGVNYNTTKTLRGGNSGLFPSEQNTQSFAYAALNASSAGYRRLMAQTEARNPGVCSDLQRQLVDLNIKLNLASTPEEKNKVLAEIQEKNTAYTNSCAM
jgi:hypothetical protein